MAIIDRIKFDAPSDAWLEHFSQIMSYIRSE